MGASLVKITLRFQGHRGVARVASGGGPFLRPCEQPNSIKGFRHNVYGNYLDFKKSCGRCT